MDDVRRLFAEVNNDNDDDDDNNSIPIGGDSVRRLVVAGCGTLGVQVLLLLCAKSFVASLNVRRIDVFDPGEVAPHDVGRGVIFRQAHVGRPKAEVVAEVLNGRWKRSGNAQTTIDDERGGKTERRTGSSGEATPGGIVPHTDMVEDTDPGMLLGAAAVIVTVRGWSCQRNINRMLHEQLELDFDGTPTNLEDVVPLVVASTRGFSGDVRLVAPGFTACVECAHQESSGDGDAGGGHNFNGRLLVRQQARPEFAVSRARDNFATVWHDPFNAFSDAHVRWIHAKAREIHEHWCDDDPITLKFVRELCQRQEPCEAVPAAAGVIAGLCCMEVMKILAVVPEGPSYTAWDGLVGSRSTVSDIRRVENCPVCSSRQRRVEVEPGASLFELLMKINDTFDIPPDSPLPSASSSVRTQRTLYMSGGPLKDTLEPNLGRTVEELDLDQEIVNVVWDLTVELGPGHVHVVFAGLRPTKSANFRG
jgi:NEDD8-activating enzyme E1